MAALAKKVADPWPMGRNGPGEVIHTKHSVH